jgi:hypothetical protein
VLRTSTQYDMGIPQLRRSAPSWKSDLELPTPSHLVRLQPISYQYFPSIGADMGRQEPRLAHLRSLRPFWVWGVFVEELVFFDSSFSRLNFDPETLSAVTMNSCPLRVVKPSVGGKSQPTRE